MKSPTGAQRLCFERRCCTGWARHYRCLATSGCLSLQAATKTAVLGSLKNPLFIGSPYHLEVKKVAISGETTLKHGPRASKFCYTKRKGAPGYICINIKSVLHILLSLGPFIIECFVTELSSPNAHPAGCKVVAEKLFAIQSLC